MIKSREFTTEEKKRNAEMEALREKYGLPGLEFCAGETEQYTQKERDYWMAESLIYDGKPIPDELAKRLMHYKAERRKPKAQKAQYLKL